MSVIKITVDEQNLHITDSPKIAAQGVNENQVEFTFSADWDGFGKTAIFYNELDPETVYTSLVDGNGLASIPHEITASEGRISLGLSGVKDNVVKTSEILTYKIVKGLYIAESAEPSPGIYEQMLTMVGAIQSDQETFIANIEADQAAFKNEIETDLAEFKSEIEANIAEIENETSSSIDVIDARVDNLVANTRAAESTTLWSGNMSTDGGSYTLSQNVSNFDFLDIFYDNVNTGVTHYLRIPADKAAANVYIPYFSGALLEIGKVALTFSGTTVTLSAASEYFWNGTDTPSAINAQVSFPVRIDGVKMASDINAELSDIRVGADGTTYTSAGAAVRGQINDEKKDLSATDARLTAIDGIVVPKMEIGTIAMSSWSIAFNSSTTNIRTPQTGGIPVSVGDVIHLTDYTSAKFRYCIQKESDGTYAYTSAYLSADYIVANAGTLYLVVAWADGSEITSVSELRSLIRIIKHEGNIYNIENDISGLETYQFIIENGHFLISNFGVGTYGSGEYNPTFRTWRVSTIHTLTYNFNILLKAKTGFRFVAHMFDGSTWTNSGWVTAYEINANIPFGLLIARTIEDTTETANVSEFVSNIIVTTDLTNNIQSLIDATKTIVDDIAIGEYMSKYYDSNQAEAYAFFTDPHLMGNNGVFDETVFNSYIRVLEDTVKRTSAAYVICGGDWLNNGDMKAQASVKLGYVDGQMRARFPGKYYPIVGNHDFNYLGVDENGTRLTESNWISAKAMRNFWFHDHEHNYYSFKKGISQNYVLDTRQDYDGTNSYDKTQLDWLAAKLIEDNSEHVTIFFHIYRLTGSESTIPKRIVALGEIISAFNAHEICTLTNAAHGYDKTYDFTDTTGHIDYCMVGHSHADFIQTLGGVPIIATINMQNGGVPSFDLVLADYTGGKLYMTRIGTGSSREVNI